MRNRRGFTLVEMMVSITIIIALIVSTMAGYSKMIKSAENARARELVLNVATALLTMYQNEEGGWPRIIAQNGDGEGKLDEKIALAFVNNRSKSRYISLWQGEDGKLIGQDRFGIVTPWAAAALKNVTADLATKEMPVPTGGQIRDHILRFAVDLDGDGITEANVGGSRIRIRMPAVVWCCGKSGRWWPYETGLKKDGIYSWTKGQVILQ